MKFFWIFFLIGISQSGGERRTYEGYKVLHTAQIENEKIAKSLMMFDGGLEGVSFWKFPQFNESVDIMVSPETLSFVTNFLDELKIGHEIKIENVEELIRNENPRVGRNMMRPQQSGFLNNNGRQATSRMNWDNYQRYNVIKDYCFSMSRSKADLVSTEVIGKSTEGRDIVLTKISRGGSGKPAIFIDGGMHAREWISPAVTTYIMNKLISTGANGRNRDLLDSFDWYFVPVINVDGYEYSHTRERMWRKTRSMNNGQTCPGVDPNRNWGFHWAESGSSSNPCSDTYHGPRAFSEPETRAVANAILARKNQIKLYLTFHSYSQLWLVPYSYGDVKPSDYNELYKMGSIGKSALERTYGTRYKIGTAPDLLYKAAGGSDDWAKGGAGIKYSYTIELRDTGAYGFILPASQIKPTSEETFNGVAAVARNLAQKLQKVG